MKCISCSRWYIHILKRICWLKDALSLTRHKTTWDENLNCTFCMHEAGAVRAGFAIYVNLHWLQIGCDLVQPRDIKVCNPIDQNKVSNRCFTSATFVFKLHWLKPEIISKTGISDTAVLFYQLLLIPFNFTQKVHKLSLFLIVHQFFSFLRFFILLM